jgi:hypothetical protein
MHVFVFRFIVCTMPRADAHAAAEIELCYYPSLNV